MAGSLTNVGEAALLNYLFRDASLGLDATNLWIALFTVTPSESATGTEVTGGSYARKSINRTGTGWDAANATAPTQTENTGAITFVTATADWGTIVSFGVCKSAAGSLATDMLAWASLAVSKTILNGDTGQFNAGSLVVTAD